MQIWIKNAHTSTVQLTYNTSKNTTPCGSNAQMKAAYQEGSRV